MTRLLLILVALLLTACATTPEPLRGEFPPITPLQTQQNPPLNAIVRWGGGIIEVQPGQRDTCVEILARPLESWARPQATTANQGRFLACTSGFLDPEVFRKNRDITIVGQVTGIERRPVGDFDYPYPRVRATAMYLWAPRVYGYYYPYRRGYWGGYWGPYGGPYWRRHYWYPGPYYGWGAWGWYYPYHHW